MEVKLDFNKQYMKFRNQWTANVYPPATFDFIAQFVNKLEKNYRLNPLLYNTNYTPASIGVNPVWYATSSDNTKSTCQSFGSSYIPPKGPYTLFTTKGFQSDHYPLNPSCVAAKLSFPEILILISKNHVCPSCTHTHDPAYMMGSPSMPTPACTATRPPVSSSPG